MHNILCIIVIINTNLGIMRTMIVSVWVMLWLHTGIVCAS